MKDIASVKRQFDKIIDFSYFLIEMKSGELVSVPTMFAPGFLFEMAKQ